MNYKNNTLWLGLAGVLLSGHAMATPSDAEISQLGNTLTPLGAIKAGNADGSIPAWDGGLCTAPADYKPIMGAKGGSPYVDPFANEKPLFQITAANLAQYKDKLDLGTLELFKRYPESFRVDVYPTHRTACYPQWVYDNTIKRVKNPKLDGPAPGLSGAHAQVPFPIPKDGYEAMWNANTKYEMPYTEGTQAAYLVDSSGGVTLSSIQKIENRNLFWDNSLDKVPDNQPYWALIASTTAPAASVGVKQMRYNFLETSQRDAMAWSYIPGQRRVRLAPEFKYDTVSTSSGGVLLFDEINGFDGKMDKFDFKLLGRKEMYVPYNTYKAWSVDPAVANTPKHLNPDVLRWELHRVWVVEATLKPGERHVQKVKHFLLDEDSWSILAYYSLDQAGKVHHLMYQPSIQQYEKPAYRNGQYVLYDMTKGAYSNASLMGAPKMTGFYQVDPYPAAYFTPGSLAGSGVR
ncbi:DUF1329 domain-containing protein [Pseudomonas nitroreducens]|uniref:DUF1329 domain-containing protein n=1 Tax=Pseudomonas nitroreducens TaxID=46680 RepID=A0A6G6J2V8_PSENT|nr:DUF1329 domain-containing protein [Pseudomonas nitroreducens]QIE89776.1 DUF1329 domain-containing protein [Pseudomonas nitroreducens]